MLPEHDNLNTTGIVLSWPKCIQTVGGWGSVLDPTETAHDTSLSEPIVLWGVACLLPDPPKPEASCPPGYYTLPQCRQEGTGDR